MLCDEALGDRRAAVGDPAHPAHVELGEARVAEDRVVDGRHRHQLVDAVLADRLKKPSRSSGPERISTRPPSSSTGISWLLQPVTWNSGTETSVDIPGPSERSIDRQRNAFSLLARKLPCVVIAPFGKPVVPLV